jgi:hypothetical protein
MIIPTQSVRMIDDGTIILSALAKFFILFPFVTTYYPRVDSKNHYTFYYQHDTIPNITNQLKHNYRTYALTKLHIDKSMSYNFQKSENHKISRC